MSRVKSQKISVIERGACHSEEERKGHWPDSLIRESSQGRDGRWSGRSVTWREHSKGGKAVWLGERLASEAFSPRGFLVSLEMRALQIRGLEYCQVFTLPSEREC